MNEVVFANYWPVVNNNDAAVDNLRVDGQDSFGIVCNFVLNVKSNIVGDMQHLRYTESKSVSSHSHIGAEAAGGDGCTGGAGARALPQRRGGRILVIHLK